MPAPALDVSVGRGRTRITRELTVTPGPHKRPFFDSDERDVYHARMEHILEIAKKLDVSVGALYLNGPNKAKVDIGVLSSPRKRPEPGRLILVSAMTPTPAGEGKTTTSIGVADALAQLDQRVCLALREPSLGPCFGMKGGGTGGGRAQLTPSDDINLHFNGDMHAISSAHNLLAAMIDNHLHFRHEPRLDPRRMLWRRVLDVNDRSLRGIVTGLGGPRHGLPRQSGFDITAASEIMAILCLSSSVEDLRARLNRILVGFDEHGAAVEAEAIGATGAMLALLKDAIHPNLVQTREGTPAFVHGGPFANIAHGCNSVLATRCALHFADWAVTEAGFGFDLGAEKFFDIKCQTAGLDPVAVVLVASVRALKLHGGAALAALEHESVEHTTAGLPNLGKHIENIARFGKTPIVAINRFDADTDAELEVVRTFCRSKNVRFAVCEHFARGGEGALELARAIVDNGHPQDPFRPLYDWNDGVIDKIRSVAQKMYGATDIELTKTAQRDLKDIDRLGYNNLPVCIAKTQSSLSDDPKVRGRPTDFVVTVDSLQINAGAGFIVVLTGEILRMPGLPRQPQALKIDVRDDKIVGLD